MHTHIYTCNLCVMHMLSLSLLWVSLFTFFASIFPSFMAPTLCTHKTNALPINELLKRTRSYTFAIPRSLPHLADPSALFFFFRSSPSSATTTRAPLPSPHRDWFVSFLLFWLLPFCVHCAFEFTKTFLTLSLVRTLVLVGTTAVLLSLLNPAYALHDHVRPGYTTAGIPRLMSSLNENNTAPSQQQAAAMPVVHPMTPADFERMQKEADERWANRPRPVQPINDDPDFAPAELRVCRLPNGGVSDHAKAQLERIRLRREEEAQQKAEKQQQQHQQPSEAHRWEEL